MNTSPFVTAVTQYMAAALSIVSFVATFILIAAVLAFGISFAEESKVTDQIAASFERELNHESPPAAQVSRSAIDDDVLYKEVNETIWSTGISNAEMYARADMKQSSNPCRAPSLVEVASGTPVK